MELNGVVEAHDVLVIEVGESQLYAGNARQFRDAVLWLVGERPNVVLDMSSVRFIDSSGLGALVGCLRLINLRSGELRLCALSSTVRALFELMRMHRVFNIHQARADAVASFAA